jgi:hypothetical protein
MGGKAVLTVAATLALAPPASAAWTALTESRVEDAETDDLDFSLRAASAPPGGSFGPSEPIAANARAAVFAAAQPRTRRVTAVWADGDGRLMSATRDP